MSKQIVTKINDRDWEKLTGVKINRAAERRAAVAERAELCAKLGFPVDCCATTGELRAL